MKVLYIADDGTQFDDEFECSEYEKVSGRKMDIIGHELIMYDEDGNEVQKPASAHYVLLKTEGAVELFFDLSDDEGLSTEGIEDPGKYILNLETEEVWGRYETLDDWHRKASNVFMQGIELINIRVDLKGFSTDVKVDKYTTVGYVIRQCGFAPGDVKATLHNGKNASLLGADSMWKNFHELGVDKSCLLSVRKDWK